MDQKLKRAAVIVGTRPEAIKLLPVVKCIREKHPGIDLHVISTGQHAEMLHTVFELFEVEPDVDLALMREDQTPAFIAAKTIELLPDILKSKDVQLLLCQGDTISAFAGALAAFYQKVSVGHVEAGLRTFDKFQPFPEEVNRTLISHVADMHFAPTELNKRNLLRESIDESSIYVTGNTVIDALEYITALPYEFSDKEMMRIVRSEKKLILVTAHRRENFGQPLVNICSALKEIAAANNDIEIVYCAHLNPNVQKTVKKELVGVERVNILPPIDYLDFVHLMKRSHIILTDSGGIQEEAPSFNVPVLVMREVTEREEAIEAGVAKLVGTDQASVVNSVASLLAEEQKYKEMSMRDNPFGDGLAAERIVEIITQGS